MNSLCLWRGKCFAERREEWGVCWG
jgi:hypothetical protein